MQPTQLRQNQMAVLNAMLVAQSAHGVFPQEITEKVRSTKLPVQYDKNEFQSLLRQYNHETAALVSAWRSRLPTELRPYGYLGLTSSNLIDCSVAMAARDVYSQVHEFFWDTLQPRLQEVQSELHGMKRAGRTHGRLAAPVQRAEVYARFERRLGEFVQRLHEDAPLGSLAGPTGSPTTDVQTAEVQNSAARSLRIRLDHIPTQLADRQSLGQWLFACTQIVGACEQLATHHRLEALSGIDRFRENFQEGQRGSSSMPHKQNPIRSERICGLARVARGHLHTMMDTATTSWWERDLTNSSVEKTAMVDLVTIMGFCLEETAGILTTMSLEDLGYEGIPDECYSHERMVQAQLSGFNPDDGLYYQLQKENGSTHVEND